jgi:opacity protein-like surface antigen
MVRTRALLFALIAGVMGAAAGVMGAAAPAAAEWNIDLYGGATWLQSSDLRVRTQDNTGNTSLTIFDLDADTGFTFGLRSGYWFDSAPFLGLDLDIFYVQMQVPAQQRTGTAAFSGDFLGKTITVSASGAASIPEASLPLFGFSPEIRLRWPLMVDTAFPAGRLQPYVSGGPAWAFSLKHEKLDMEFGGKFGGGMSFGITPTIALFGEYRYILFPEFQFTGKHGVTYAVDVHSHSAIGGISFRF